MRHLRSPQWEEIISSLQKRIVVRWVDDASKEYFSGAGWNVYQTGRLLGSVEMMRKRRKPSQEDPAAVGPLLGTGVWASKGKPLSFGSGMFMAKDHDKEFNPLGLFLFPNIKMSSWDDGEIMNDVPPIGSAPAPSQKQQANKCMTDKFNKFKHINYSY